MKLLVTGGAGFIGSNFINYWLNKYKEDYIINIDRLTYAANPEYVKQKYFEKRYKFIKGDINDKELMEKSIKDSDVIINFAAESHVDNSIKSAEPFIISNYYGVYNILELIRKYDKRFHQISTDEVFGSLPLHSNELFDENTKYNPKNPYSATKAGADMLIRSYINTYNIKATISNCSNNFGPNQHKEKLIPKTILNALNNEKIPVYGNGLQIRDWIYVEDHCSGIDDVIHKGNIGNSYLFSARNEIKNIDIIKRILKTLNKDESLISYVNDRPGHDVRYGINPDKAMKELNWKPKYNFDDALKITINHYKKNMNLNKDL
ncbi:dTDP-glucose 4,6-dehydratase [Oxyplasma meridianum]|uniref:dTDP-glucose 4,6-dehydratase n=1 Tax=Oxyplasma meridianum TaxID=3073602 RepID=A0AAX4NHC7_9ARCH